MTEAVRVIAPLEPPSPPAAKPIEARALALPSVRRHALSDREFLAPALEILETPASPVQIAFLWTICALVGVALIWAYFGRIDIIASAQGKFQPTGNVKVIEPLETGRVAAIYASNDTPVKAGDIVVELDRSAAEADVGAAKDELASARAETLRRQAALTAARARAFSSVPAIDWPDDVSLALRQREDQVLSADLGQLGAALASFDAQRAQKSAERDMLLQTIAAQKRLVATLQERVDMRTRLVELQAGAKAAVIDATETLEYQQTQLAMQLGQLASLSTGLDVVARDSEKAIQSFLSDDAQKLSDAERRVEDARSGSPRPRRRSTISRCAPPSQGGCNRPSSPMSARSSPAGRRSCGWCRRIRSWRSLPISPTATSVSSASARRRWSRSRPFPSPATGRSRRA